MASLAEFKASALGQLVGAIINDQENIIRMIALSESGIPAVQAIGKRLIPRMPPDQDLTEIKKNIGRWVKQILEPAGWTPVGKGRVAPGNLFSTGTVYGSKNPVLLFRWLTLIWRKKMSLLWKQGKKTALFLTIRKKGHIRGPNMNGSGS